MSEEKKVKMNVRVLVHRGYDLKEKVMLSANELTKLGIHLLPNGQWANLPENIIIMQFVTREDEAGVPIFENDIIDVDIKTEMGLIRARGVMGWDGDLNGFHLKIASSNGNAVNGVATNMKVVGNIFDDKEMLKEDPALPEAK